MCRRTVRSRHGGHNAPEPRRPTFAIGVQYGRVKPGDTVAVVGAGPVGLAVMATARFYGAGGLAPETQASGCHQASARR